MHREPADYPTSVEDYLVGEVRSPARHEYVGGVTYDMAGANNAHNQIAANVLVALANRLRGGRCRPFNSDTKVRIRLPFQLRFYYPDVSVTCRPNEESDSFQDEPVIVVEVVSASTRRIDEGEKCLAYQAIPSLSAYLLIEQDATRVVVFRRAVLGFVREEYVGLGGAVPLPEVACELPLAEVYDGLKLAARG